jgi:hypothetical protein
VGDYVSYLVPGASCEEVGEATSECLFATYSESRCNVDKILLSGSHIEESVRVSLAEEDRLRGLSEVGVDDDYVLVCLSGLY